MQLDGISKRFGAIAVLSRISLTFTKGERVLLLGRNGAGKSTLLRICAGLMRPEGGSIHIGKERVRAVPLGQVGYAGHQPMLYAELTIKENLKLARTLRRVPQQVEDYMRKWQLCDYAEKRISQLSKGLQARASLAHALLHNPEYIFLDEPTSALDDVATQLLFKHVSNLPESLVVIASHDISRVQQSCSRVVLLECGFVAADSNNGQAPNHVIDRYRRENR